MVESLLQLKRVSSSSKANKPVPYCDSQPSLTKRRLCTAKGDENTCSRQLQEHDRRHAHDNVQQEPTNTYLFSTASQTPLNAARQLQKEKKTLIAVKRAFPAPTRGQHSPRPLKHTTILDSLPRFIQYVV
jgi:hypothetical protein